MLHRMSKRRTFNKRKSKYNIIDEYYLLVIYELESGQPMEHIEIMLKDYEKKEMYLACAGINKAIEHVRFFALYELIIRLCLDEQTDNLKLEYENPRYKESN